MQNSDGLKEVEEEKFQFFISEISATISYIFSIEVLTCNFSQVKRIMHLLNY